VNTAPLQRTMEFWKPLANGQNLGGIGEYRHPDDPLAAGVNVVRPDTAPAAYRVIEDDSRYSLFAAVHRIDEVPDTAQALAQITDFAGAPYSYVLWYPERRAVVVPFDTDAAIRALQLEQYVPPQRRTAVSAPLLAAYYAVKPMIPADVKLALRRSLARKTLASETFLSWPIDRSLDLLQRLLLRVMLLATHGESIRFLWFWPSGHPWAAVLTHDVETAEGLANVPRVMAMEQRHGLRSSFNLVAHDYAKAGSELGAIRSAGFEIGVHGYRHDGRMFTSWSRFLERAVAVNECARRWDAVGFRSPATYRNLEWMDLLRVEYDSSLTDTAPLEPQPDRKSVV